MALIRICYSDDWFVDYDRDRGMYRVSYFQDNHFVNECWFDAYEEKELGADFPQTIGDMTFYSKAQLFDWVENQQKVDKERFVTIPSGSVLTKEQTDTVYELAKTPIEIDEELLDKFNSIGCTSFSLKYNPEIREIFKEDILNNRVEKTECSVEDWKRLGYTDEEAEKLVEASKIYK